MAQCPKCREVMPPLSKICPVCGYTDTSIDAYEGKDSISMIFADMQECVRKIKSFSMPSVFDGMRSIAFISYPILFLLMFVIAAASESTLAWGLTLLALVMSIVSIVRKLKGNGSADRHNKQILSIKAQYEASKQSMLLKYGASRDIKQATAALDNDLSETLDRRKSSARRSALLGIVVSVVMLSIATVLAADITKSAIEESLTEEVESE